jgi:predicted lipid-binding transport protein (Tim44 family)
MSTENTYNGWMNYATWRVNLEYFDGRDILDSYRDKPDAHDLADELRSELMDYLETECENSLTLSYAQSFVFDVDFLEIAEHLIEAAEYEEEAEQ